ncbi:MAG: glycosyltransferase family 4 protein [Propionibacteriaceae bacterium]|nr:glycosyltransferase family 4 protein [Propionibacteriaceae bacterium]
MRFVFFSAQYLPTVGGIEIYNRNLGAALASSGHEVVIVTSALPGVPAVEAGAGVTVVRTPAALLMGGRYPVPRVGTRFRQLLDDHVWDKPVDLAVIHTRFWALSLWATRECRRRGIPAIVVEHGSAYLSLGQPLLDFVIRVYERLALGYVRRRVRGFYAVSRAGVDWLSSLGVRASGVLYNAVDAEDVCRQADSVVWDVRAGLGLDPATPLVVYAGRLIPEKGIHELVEAMSLVRRLDDSVHLVIAGSGPMAAELGDLRATGVHFIGALDHPSTMALLRQADVFCMPSRSEGFSTVVLEAAALETYQVTTPVGGTAELLLDDSYGGRLKDRDPQTIADALVRALGDAAGRGEATRKTKARLLEHFTWQQTADRLVALVTS